jgi:indolepyruvate ferredoxin oxidoreductase beta subunit
VALAHETGDLKYQNVVALGALYALIRDRIEEASLMEALKQSVPPKTIDTNMAAFDKGKSYVQSHFLRET